jgi:hypothetical protein
MGVVVGSCRCSKATIPHLKRRQSYVLTKTSMALVGAALLAVSIPAIGPAMATQDAAGITLVNYSFCTENPSARGCPGYVGSEQTNRTRHAAHRPNNPANKS